MCHATDEPIFITKNGYGDLVLMSMEVYEKRLARVEIYVKVLEAEEKIQSDQALIDADPAFGNIRRKHARGTISDLPITRYTNSNNPSGRPDRRPDCFRSPGHSRDSDRCTQPSYPDADACAR